MPNKIVEILMERDEMSQAEAQELLEEARVRFYRDGENPEEILLEEFGIEPDYIFDFIEL